MTKQWLLEKLSYLKIPNDILNAFSRVEREEFVPKGYRHLAYKDIALPIGYDQTISQPSTIAIMLSILELKEGNKVLEVGSGSGYLLALMSKIVRKSGKVYGIERIKGLFEDSKLNLNKQQNSYKNVHVYNKNGKSGLPDKTPFDRIIISAAAQEIPEELLKQLNNYGILVVPVGNQRYQSLIAIQKINNEFLIKNRIPGFTFVPFL